MRGLLGPEEGHQPGAGGHRQGPLPAEGGGQEEGAGGEVKKKEQGAECIVKVLYRFLLRTVLHRFLSA